MFCRSTDKIIPLRTKFNRKICFFLFKCDILPVDYLNSCRCTGWTIKTYDFKLMHAFWVKKWLQKWRFLHCRSSFISCWVRVVWPKSVIVWLGLGSGISKRPQKPARRPRSTNLRKQLTKSELLYNVILVWKWSAALAVSKKSLRRILTKDLKLTAQKSWSNTTRLFFSGETWRVKSTAIDQLWLSHWRPISQKQWPLLHVHCASELLSIWSQVWRMLRLFSSVVFCFVFKWTLL